MEGVPDSREDRPEPQIPKELAEDLVALFGKGAKVPPRVDREILARAGARFAGGRARRSIARWVAAASSVAAALLVVSLIVRPMLRREAAVREVHRLASSETLPAAEAEPGGRADLDGNGTVNIVDAFLLALRLEAAPESKASWDINADGVVDRGDVDAIAMAAVKL